MAEYSDWRNYWWLQVAILGFTFFLVFFGFPETKWHRLHPNEQTGMAKVTSGPGSDEKVVGDTVERSDILKEGSPPPLTHAQTAERDPYLHKGTPSKAQFGLYTPNKHPLQSILLDLWIPIKLFAFPIVEFASFIVSWSASCFLTLNLTQAHVFERPPYGFKSTSIGFTNFAILVGGIIGLVTAGPLSDWVSMKLTKRNKGIREPEMRLLTMIPYVIIMIIGNFIVAFGYQQQWSWKVSYLESLPIAFADLREAHRHNRIHMCRHPSRCSSSHHLNIRCGLIQAGRWIHLRQYYSQQECLGLRLLEVHYAMDGEEWLCKAHHDEHDSDDYMVSFRCIVLVRRQAVQGLDQEQ